MSSWSNATWQGLSTPRLGRGMLAITWMLLALAGGCRSETASIPYSLLLREIRAGNVDAIEINRDSVDVRFTNVPAELQGTSRRTHRAVLPPVEGDRADLLKLLEEQQVPFQVRE